MCASKINVATPVTPEASTIRWCGANEVWLSVSTAVARSATWDTIPLSAVTKAGNFGGARLHGVQIAMGRKDHAFVMASFV
jgi:hypothetical protein